MNEIKMIAKGDIVCFHNEKYKVVAVKKKGDAESLKLKSLDGRTVIYNVGTYGVQKVKES